MNTKALYWGSTGLVALLALASDTMYFVQSPTETFAHLGFPDYFRVQLGVAKLGGGGALLVPLPRGLKEWTYVGFTIDFGSAIIAQLAVRDPLSSAVTPMVPLIILLTSYASYHQYVLGAASDDRTGSESRLWWGLLPVEVRQGTLGATVTRRCEQ